MLPTWVLPEDGNDHTSNQGQQGIFLSWFGDSVTQIGEDFCAKEVSHLWLWHTCFWRATARFFSTNSWPSLISPVLELLGSQKPANRSVKQWTKALTSMKLRCHSLLWNRQLAALWFFCLESLVFNVHEMLESYLLLFTTSSDWLFCFVHFDDSEFPCDDFYWWTWQLKNMGFSSRKHHIISNFL